LGGGLVTCVQVSAGALHSVLLLSDGLWMEHQWTMHCPCV
jgi:hypothetical protein